MKELLFFILGLIIGGLATTTLMCCLQINRINKMEEKCFELERLALEAQDED